MRKIAKVVIGLFLVVMIGGALVLEYYDGYVVVTPTQLPNARVGQPYNAGITIHGMHPIKSIGPIDKTPNITFDFGKNAKLTASYDFNNQDNTVWITGIPEHKGKYPIRIQTGFHGGGELWLDKTFELIVD